MVLNKLFGKKKETYFFEAKDNTTDNTETAVEATGETETTEATPATSATPVATVSQANVAYDVPDWVKAIKNYSNQDGNNANQSQVENFAGKYISNNVPFSRRRPGPSLAPFKVMASKIGK